MTTTTTDQQQPTNDENQCEVVNASKVAQVFVNELKKTIKENQLKPKLVGFLANDDPSAVTYANWTGKSCSAIGIEFELRRLKREDLEEAILEANKDKSVNGIMVYYPVFGGGFDQYLQNCCSTYKDVEGLSHPYRFNMYHNIRFLDEERTLKCIVPCTPLAIIKCLEYVGVYDKSLEIGHQLKGKTISIINRSEVVGRPLAALLANDGAIVYSIDISDVLEFRRSSDNSRKVEKHYVTDTTLKPEDCLPVSDVVITGVPSPTYKVNIGLCKPGFTAINFSSHKNFDEDVQTKAGVFIPSIGKVTITMLQRNLVRLNDYQLLHKD